MNNFNLNISYCHCEACAHGVPIDPICHRDQQRYLLKLDFQKGRNNTVHFDFECIVTTCEDSINEAQRNLHRDKLANKRTVWFFSDQKGNWEFFSEHPLELINDVEFLGEFDLFDKFSFDATESHNMDNPYPFVDFDLTKGDNSIVNLVHIEDIPMTPYDALRNFQFLYQLHPSFNSVIVNNIVSFFGIDQDFCYLSLLSELSGHWSNQVQEVTTRSEWGFERLRKELAAYEVPVLWQSIDSDYEGQEYKNCTTYINLTNKLHQVYEPIEYYIVSNKGFISHHKGYLELGQEGWWCKNLCFTVHGLADDWLKISKNRRGLNNVEIQALMHLTMKDLNPEFSPNSSYSELKKTLSRTKIQALASAYNHLAKSLAVPTLKKIRVDNKINFTTIKVKSEEIFKQHAANYLGSDWCLTMEEKSETVAKKFWSQVLTSESPVLESTEMYEEELRSTQYNLDIAKFEEGMKEFNSLIAFYQEHGGSYQSPKMPDVHLEPAEAVNSVNAAIKQIKESIKDLSGAVRGMAAISDEEQRVKMASKYEESFEEFWQAPITKKKKMKVKVKYEKGDGIYFSGVKQDWKDNLRFNVIAMYLFGVDFEHFMPDDVEVISGLVETGGWAFDIYARQRYKLDRTSKKSRAESLYYLPSDIASAAKPTKIIHPPSFGYSPGYKMRMSNLVEKKHVVESLIEKCVKDNELKSLAMVKKKKIKKEHSNSKIVSQNLTELKHNITKALQDRKTAYKKLNKETKKSLNSKPSRIKKARLETLRNMNSEEEIKRKREDFLALESIMKEFKESDEKMILQLDRERSPDYNLSEHIESQKNLVKKSKIGYSLVYLFKKYLDHGKLKHAEVFDYLDELANNNVDLCKVPIVWTLRIALSNILL